ncbi:calmodulin-regulated spectrin-associated protein 1a [Brachionichthys hirsutus]|uniref:calmodulin-regulated spectrin-associated protein 1a n=1 Tax=Brachionichthys hirsutus TaxID=412623 RepID=UPI003604CC56
MDADAGAGRDSTWRTAGDDAGGRGVQVQVVPVQLYDPARAKIDANLRWLFARAYRTDHIPVDLRDPFYMDQYEQEHIKPPIIRLLLSGELYLRAWGSILGAEQASPPQSHQSVIQALSRRGIPVLQADETPVSDLDLRSAPIRMSSHVHLIDALMMASVAEMVSVEKVLSSVSRFSTFSASRLPSDLEEATIFWINEVNTKTKEITEKEHKMKQRLLESPSHQKSPSKWYWKLVPVRYRRDHLSGDTLQHFPLVAELLPDGGVATALLAVVHFYCPELIRLEDVCLKEVPSVADSLYNIQLLQEFSNRHLKQSFHLKPEDLLYSPPVLKSNVMVFIAELFWWFESVRPEFVQPRDLKEIRDVRLLLQPKASRPHLPVSVTKRRFLTASNAADVSNAPLSPDLSTDTSSPSPPPTLPPPRRRRHRGAEENASETNRSTSMACTDQQRRPPKPAWPERRPRPVSQPVPYALHCPPDDDADGISLGRSLGRSISKDSLASSVMMGSSPQPPRHRLGVHSLLSHMRIEDEDEERDEDELVAGARRLGSDMEQDELEIQSATSAPRVPNTRRPPRPDAGPFLSDGYHLEPLMPAVPKTAKEKTITLNKEEESGETRRRSAATARRAPVTSRRKSPVESVSGSLRPPKEASRGTKPPQGFFLHLSREPSPLGQDSDSDIADLEEDEEEEDDPMDLTEEVAKRGKGKYLEEGGVFDFGEAEGESAKLREDSKVSERDDKEDCSGRSSPGLSTVSWASSCSGSGSTSVRMTSFAERKLLKLGLRDGFSSTSSSQKTTPDGSEVAACLPWQPRSDWMGKEAGPPVVPSEQLQLHMQLEEQRRAIEYQKKKMETLSARQRLKLGKAAFLNIVKKSGGKSDGKSDTLPLPLKHSASADPADKSKARTQSCKDDSCLDVLKVQARAGQPEGGQVSRDGRLSGLGAESHSIDLLNEAISSIQQQMLQLTLQQGLLMKRVAPPPEHASDSNTFAVHFGNSSTPTRRPPKLSSSQRSGARRGPASAREKAEDSGADGAEARRGGPRDGTSRTQEEFCVDAPDPPAISRASAPQSQAEGPEQGDEKEARVKGHLIQVDLSEPLENAADGEQKSVLGFFFKDDEKAADEMAKRRAAFLLKQQRKAEETRVRKQQQEAETELKRDEARRKAEEDRFRKEEEKARRELIKQEHLRRKQEALMEEQGLVKPRPRTKSRRNRPKSLHRGESSSLPMGSTTPDLSCSHRGSTLSLAPEADSVISGGAGSQRAASACSMESFAVLSRMSSRNTERDWDNGSMASSITSVEYSGPKLFKEPSTKSNKPIIINAIAHCCLAGKVNETQKNAVLEELEKCDSNHLIILFRDGGCQFRAVYSFSPDTGELVKFTGTGPRSIGHKMVDRLYKYNSDRKQFTVIPARSVSVSVDALIIHNHLWQIKRPGSARRK